MNHHPTATPAKRPFSRPKGADRNAALDPTNVDAAPASTHRGVQLAPPLPIPSTRDPRIDLLRGLAHLVIFVDHVPQNPFKLLTPQAYASFDAAEAFVFIAGLVAGLVYTRTLLTHGWTTVWGKVLRRCGQVYLAFLGLTFALLGLIGSVPGHNPGDFGRFFTDPTAFRDALLLRFAPGLPDVLALYVFLMLLLPVGLWLHRRSRRELLVLSFGLYVGTQFAIFRMPWGWDGWYFNPLAWQFLFFVGVSFGATQAERAATGEAPRPRASYKAAAVAIAVFAVIVVVRLVDDALHVRPLMNRILLLNTTQVLYPLADKWCLGPVRVIQFLAVAFACAALIRRDAPFLRGPIARALSLPGRHSLPIYCLGAVLSVAGGCLTDYVGYSVSLLAAINVAGCLLLIAVAYGLEKHKRRTSPRSAASRHHVVVRGPSWNRPLSREVAVA